VGELAETTPLLRVRILTGYRGFESLPVRHLSDNPIKTPISGTFRATQSATNTLSAKKSYGLRLLRVNGIYYYRRTIKGKDCKISLRTRDFKLAFHRRNLFNMLNNEEFMFQVKKGDYEFIFEYDTIEELKFGKQMAEEDYQNFLRENKERFDLVKQQIQATHNEPDTPVQKQRLTFAQLEPKFLKSKKDSGKVGASTYKAYATAFDKAKKYFKDRPIQSLDIHDFEEHRDYLKGKIKPKTINNHIAYVSMFMDYAEKYGYLNKNHCKGVDTLKVDYTKKSNFIDKEIKEILLAPFPTEENENYNLIFTIAIFSGMRISEIISLQPENICKDEETDIYYFDLIDSKTNAGIRKVPIHEALLHQNILRAKFPLLGNRTINAGEKKAMSLLYSVIDKGLKKTFHTLRGTAISKMSNANPDKIEVIQEIVGHSKGDKSLTLDTYAKGFALGLKKNIIDSIDYGLF
jgi:integrase